MNQSTCVNPLCNSDKVVCKGYCNLCYQRLYRTGDPNGPKCIQCGEYIWLKKPKGWQSRSYCSPACKSHCRNPSCSETAVDRNGYCAACYMRWHRYGDPNGRRCETCGNPLWLTEHEGKGCSRYCSIECRPRCSVDGCTRHVKAFGLCATHDRRKRCGIALTAPLRDTCSEMVPCRICGALPETWDLSKQHFNSLCSPRCIHLAQMGAKRPTSTVCTKCGRTIDLMAITPNGHLTKSDTKLCPECRARPTRVRIDRKRLWKAQGGACSICGLQMDLAIGYPSRLSVVGDHIIPLARGGANTRSNIALAHSLCNILKSSSLPSEINRDEMIGRILEAEAERSDTHCVLVSM